MAYYREVAARDATLTRARAARRLLRLALCGVARPVAAPSAAGAESLCPAAAAAPSGAPRRGQPGEHRHGLAARALSEMLCAESQAARCRATVRALSAWQRAAPRVEPCRVALH